MLKRFVENALEVIGGKQRKGCKQKSDAVSTHDIQPCMSIHECLSKICIQKSMTAIPCGVAAVDCYGEFISEIR